MRLFIFKAETSPPFQLGPCLDAVAHLLFGLEEYVDAKENFGFAAEKYDLIQQPILAEVMRIKGTECSDGPEAALPLVQALIGRLDPGKQIHASSDTRAKNGLARAYAYLAELLLKTDATANAVPAASAAEYSTTIGWDRQHTAWLLLGQAKQQFGDLAGAGQAFDRALQIAPNFLAAYEASINVNKGLKSEPEKLLKLLDAAIAIHPRSLLLREKAFALSDAGQDAEALAYLETLIANPPPEETDSISFGSGGTVATLYKAKAAILADGQKLPEALAAAKAAVEANPNDEEAVAIAQDIESSMSSQ
jgi:tetratricopeptide (TPR) repeat protein